MTPRALIGTFIFALISLLASSGAAQVVTGGHALGSSSEPGPDPVTKTSPERPAPTAPLSALGSAIFNPFSEAPSVERSRPPAADHAPDRDAADFTLTAVVALGALGVFAYALRRALDVL
jgi:hypothetical protein